MYYFIPSWSGSGKRVWHRDIIPWYRSMQRLEFDDTIHQIRIFQSEDLPVKLLLQAYMPHARYLLSFAGKDSFMLMLSLELKALSVLLNFSRMTSLKSLKFSMIEALSPVLSTMKMVRKYTRTI